MMRPFLLLLLSTAVFLGSSIAGRAHAADGDFATCPVTPEEVRAAIPPESEMAICRNDVKSPSTTCSYICICLLAGMVRKAGRDPYKSSKDDLTVRAPSGLTQGWVERRRKLAELQTGADPHPAVRTPQQKRCHDARLEISDGAADGGAELLIGDVC